MNAGYRIRKLTQWIALVALVVATLPGPALAQSEVIPAISVQDNPTTLIGGVTSYYLRDPKLFSHHAPPPCGPSAAEAPQVTTYESVQRIPSRGGLTPRSLSRSARLQLGHDSVQHRGR